MKKDVKICKTNKYSHKNNNKCSNKCKKRRKEEKEKTNLNYID